jgi:CarD family transcriptional regulator
VTREDVVRKRRERKLDKIRTDAAEKKESVASTAGQQPDDGLPVPRVKLAVGDLVVYGNHGIGRVATRRKQEVLGKAQEVVVLELEELSVILPLALARTQLRPLVNEAELGRVGEALRDDGVLDSRNWLSRRREALEKLIGGTPVELAQIVSEGAQRERLRSASRGTRHLSLSEREIFTKARSLLSNEIAVALDIQPAAAESWIDCHLARPA